MSRASKTSRSASRPPSADEIDDVDRRVSEGGGLLAWLRRMRGMLRRPLGLRRRGLQLDIVLVDRRRNPPHQGPAVARICAELRVRLGALEREHVLQTMRPLLQVYEELRRRGWAGVEPMSSRRLSRAGRQVRLLHELEPSAAMAYLADRLRLMQAAAEAREEHSRAVRQQEAAAAPDVRETDFSEFQRHDTRSPSAGDDSQLPAEPVPAAPSTPNAPSLAAAAIAAGAAAVPAAASVLPAGAAGEPAAPGRSPGS